MRRLLILAIVLCGLTIAADRAALATAQTRIAAEVQKEADLADRPSVDLLGFPFLTQAVGGQYDGGRLVAHDLRTDKLKVNRLVIHLREVKVPLVDLITGDISAVPVGAVTGLALVTYAELAAATGVSGLTIAPKGDKLELTFPPEHFRTDVPVIATARIGVTEQAVRITSVLIQGVRLPDMLTAAVLAKVQENLEVGALPYGLQVTDVRVAEAGVEVSASAKNAVLRKP